MHYKAGNQACLQGDHSAVGAWGRVWQAHVRLDSEHNHQLDGGAVRQALQQHLRNTGWSASQQLPSPLFALVGRTMINNAGAFHEYCNDKLSLTGRTSAEQATHASSAWLAM